jgi:negative regulator of flagellin synthesis FlgM
MSIDIKNLTQAQARPASDGRVAENAGVRGRQEPQGQESGGGGDRVTLTDTARRLSDLASTVSGQPPVDRKRVDEIRAAIQDGSYEVKPERIAERLLTMEGRGR